jgi:predicted SprT family Zn-dependent metalloprotease
VSPKDKKPTEKPPVCAKHHVEMRRTESDRGARVWRCYQCERETREKPNGL